MTHIVHPYGQRIGILRGWKSRWFAKDTRRYKELLRADTLLREFLVKKLKGMYASEIEIERSDALLRVIIKTSRPGMIIGRSGEGATRLKKDIVKKLNQIGMGHAPEIRIDVEEVRSPESNAAIVAEMVVESLEKRMPFRRVLKQTADKVMANRDVKGVRIAVAGRLGGAEMSRAEQIKRGRIPLQTLRADVDFKKTDAYMPYTGLIGVKVWIYKGDIFEQR